MVVNEHDEHQHRSTNTKGNQQTSRSLTNTNECQWTSTDIIEYQRRSTIFNKQNGHQQTSTDVNKHQRTLRKINERKRTYADTFYKGSVQNACSETNFFKSQALNILKLKLSAR